MVYSCQTSPGLQGPRVGHRHLRRPSRETSLRTTVRLAVDSLFRFKFRSTRSKALWCQTERVWLGRQTFLHWALCDTDIDISRAAARAADAPQNADELRKAVREELGAYWAILLGSLPRETQPYWMPLP